MADDVDLGWRGDDKQLASLAGLKKAQLNRAKMNEFSDQIFPVMKMLLHEKNNALKIFLKNLNKSTLAHHRMQSIGKMPPAGRGQKPEKAMAMPLHDTVVLQTLKRMPDQKNLHDLNKIVLKKEKSALVKANAIESKKRFSHVIERPRHSAVTMLLAIKAGHEPEVYSTAIGTRAFGVNQKAQAFSFAARGEKISTLVVAPGGYSISRTNASLQKTQADETTMPFATVAKAVLHSAARLSQSRTRQVVRPGVALGVAIVRPFIEKTPAKQAVISPAPRYENTTSFEAKQRAPLAFSKNFCADLASAVSASLLAAFTPDRMGENRASAPMPVVVVNPEDLQGGMGGQLIRRAGVQTGPTGFDYALTLLHPTGAY